ncbi:hypothetical protein [Gimesia chilikensis]|uniref:Uncharacterized protein n=1 Tax=Gimesia chilikensis TaxID=2605989 RepID=A0A517PWG6_9PLAN|nr:hypothetical protein [Gimesia chilikensis]QDT23719.1 hypothetical protein HG66A1_55430 [Gimesia chilikensis]
MHEDFESTPPNTRRVKPGLILFLCIVLVSGLFIYRIQSRHQLPDQTTVEKQTVEPELTAEDSTEEEAEEKTTPIEESVTPSTETVLTQTAHRQPLLPDEETVKQGELDSTSWQNPFYRLLWKNSGWKFTDEGMESPADQFCIATFIRPYKKVSVSFRVDVKQSFPDFELQLLTRDPAQPDQVLVASQIHFQNTGVTVTAAGQKTKTELKNVKVDLQQAQPGSVPVRLVGTGNRFVISIGRRRILTCAQPATQSGKECYLCFMADKQPVRITALRLEGE